MIVLDDWLIGFVQATRIRLSKQQITLAANSRAKRAAKIWRSVFYANNPVMFLWQLPQNMLGLCYALLRNTTGQVYAITYNYGAVTVHGAGWQGSSVSLGKYLCLGNGSEAIPGTGRGSYTWMHEYGHFRQSQASGWLYLLMYGLPSISGKKWTEHDANLRAARYFETEAGFSWQSDYYPPDSFRHRYSYLPQKTKEPSSLALAAFHLLLIAFVAAIIAIR